MQFTIQRLTTEHAAAIVNCFQRVYGNTYAEGLFYDSAEIEARLADGSLRSVGAVTESGQVVGHMAMTIVDSDQPPELGNTVVDPDMRGSGLAWQVGAELTSWCAELGYPGFIHYPTAAHHIMQRHSVKSGFEVGLMLGYIPAETDGKVIASKNTKREAATVVFEPLDTQDKTTSPALSSYLPAYGADFIVRACTEIGLQRHWLTPNASNPLQHSQAQTSVYPKRSLARLKVSAIGADLDEAINAQHNTIAACYQIDLPMDSPAIDTAVYAALRAGYFFCGWLPGHNRGDVLRLQKVDRQQTNLAPALENPFAQALLAWLKV
ncbi:MAG: GNAT family N-acetyltransferase [Pseudomonadaceae bacterium]|nr:GNAT family N-acetyltransferase [Pseudomonadaceae bacterium]